MRLHDLGWFMRCLNKHTARQANAEDGCTGRFWEGRYKSQALPNETVLLTCMSDVGLNPIRVGIAETPETSDFTSLQARIKALIKETSKDGTVPLLAFGGDDHAETSVETLPMHLDDYLTLVDWTGRAQRQDKRGAIPELLPPFLSPWPCQRINGLRLWPKPATATIWPKDPWNASRPMPSSWASVGSEDNPSVGVSTG
jgi:hypothetical protein